MTGNVSRLIPVGLALEIPEHEWGEVGCGRQRLKATVILNGLDFHLDAFEVAADKSGVQHAAPELDQTLVAIHEALAADGPFETLSISGRNYVVVATPFC